jgi:hypothetical protein
VDVENSELLVIACNDTLFFPVNAGLEFSVVHVRVHSSRYILVLFLLSMPDQLLCPIDFILLKSKLILYAILLWLERAVLGLIALW